MKPQSPSATTDVTEFISDLDGGQFERKLSIALSQAAAAAMDTDKSAVVNMSFTLKKITGTHQVTCEHFLEFTKPTESGDNREREKRTTVLHVGQYGRISLAQPSLMGEQAEIV